MKNNKLHLFTIAPFKSLFWLLLPVSCVFFTSCEKDHFWDFAKSSGKNTTINREVNANFTQIYLHDDINLVITQGSTYSIKLEGGENVLPGIETSISDSILTLRNNNTFNWVRSYKKGFTAYVTLPHLLELKYEATGNVSNTDTIREDSLSVSCIGGSGYINLVIKTGTSKLGIGKGSADLQVSGTSGVSYVFLGAYGPIRSQNLVSTYLFIRNSGTNDCFVNVNHQLEYEISGLGNIYYSGNPVIITGASTSSGKLIKSD